MINEIKEVLNQFALDHGGCINNHMTPSYTIKIQYVPRFSRHVKQLYFALDGTTIHVTDFRRHTWLYWLFRKEHFTSMSVDIADPKCFEKIEKFLAKWR